jgi:hypothetical protein
MKRRPFIAWLIPLLTGGLLIARASVDQPGLFGTTAEIEAYLGEVKARIEAVPFQTGAWLGSDIPATPAAVEMLKPNKLMQRRYTNIQTGETFELLIVHCGDVRDMIGHYPPVCYPAQGWKPGGRNAATIALGDLSADATRYAFHREGELTVSSIEIVNLFALPGGDGASLGPDLAIIERAGRFRERARLGAAQIQVITDPAYDPERRREIVNIAFSLTREVLEQIERGPR